MNPLWSIPYTLLPMAGALLGGLFSSFSRPKKSVQSFIEHFVAGIVIGAVAIELLPRILGRGKWGVALGFALGAALMILLHEWAHHLKEEKGKKTLPLGLIVASGIDLWIDGLLIGLSFLVGRGSGLFIAFSLTFCAFFLNLAVAAALKKREFEKKAVMGVSALLALTLPLGALVGALLMSHFYDNFGPGILAFGVAALLFLGVEELLGESHVEEETPWITAAFFVGFLFILVVESFFGGR